MRAKGVAGRSGIAAEATHQPAGTGPGAPRRADERRGSGFTLVSLLWLLALTSGLFLYAQSARMASPTAARDVRTARSLAAAKTALIARAATATAPGAREIAPGHLPFPDRNRDGNYDGRGDCVTFGLNDSHLLGRLPRAGDASPCPPIGLGVAAADAAGEPLWYAVSRNLVTRGSPVPVNPRILEPGVASYPWLVVRDAQGRVVEDPRSRAPLAIAAVILAPGAALEGQDRRGPAPAAKHFLDRITIGGAVYDDADSDGCRDAASPPCFGSSSGEEFVIHPGVPAAEGFNDRLVYLGAGELLRALERRVLGEVAIALNRYRDAYGTYPWLSPFADPRAATFDSDGARRGLLALHQEHEWFATRFDAAWDLVDRSPSTSARHSGDASLVPRLSDLLSGSIRIGRASGRCMWSESTRGDCRGSHVSSGHYRADLGRNVTRTVEVAIAVEDDTPSVTPPTSTDVRRRSLAARPVPAPGAWTIRVTDDDGAQWGQRVLRIDGDTAGTLALAGIRYELSVVYDDIADDRDELPEWLVDNDWHHFIYVALSQDAAPGGDSDGDGDCSTPVNTCLSLKVAGRIIRSDIRALLVSSGIARASQDRSIGDCDADGLYDDFLCAYFEGDNADVATPAAADTFARDAFSARFDDQVRVVAPLPP